MLLVLPVLFGLVHSSSSNISPHLALRTHLSLTHSLTHSLARSCARSPPTHPSTHSPTYQLTHLSSHPTIHPPTHPPTYPLAKHLIHTAVHPLSHSPTCPPIPTLAHPPILPLVCPATRTLSSSQKIVISRTLQSAVPVLQALAGGCGRAQVTLLQIRRPGWYEEE